MKRCAAGILISFLVGCSPATQTAYNKDTDTEIKAAASYYGVCTIGKAVAMSKSLARDTSAEEIAEKAIGMCQEERDFYRRKLEIGMSSIIKTQEMADKLAKATLTEFDRKNKEILIKTVNNARTKEL